MKERIQKLLSSRGVASRREAEKMITAGRVLINGSPASLGQSADPEADSIEIDGAALPETGERVYIMLNKPRGYITTMRDEKSRRSAAELVVDCKTKIYPVGRLDMDSDGLLLFTNDGDFAYKATHPRFEKAKKYVVSVRGDIKGAMPQLKEPVEIDGREVCALDVSVISLNKTGGDLEITIGEGRNRQVRRMCERCGLRAVSLTRTAFGDIKLGDLKRGTWRHLTQAEISGILKEDSK